MTKKNKKNVAQCGLEAGLKPLGNHRLLGEMRKAWQGFEWLLEVAQQASVMQT